MIVKTERDDELDDRMFRQSARYDDHQQALSYQYQSRQLQPPHHPNTASPRALALAPAMFANNPSPNQNRTASSSSQSSAPVSHSPPTEAFAAPSAKQPPGSTATSATQMKHSTVTLIRTSQLTDRSGPKSAEQDTVNLIIHNDLNSVTRGWCVPNSITF